MLVYDILRPLFYLAASSTASTSAATTPSTTATSTRESIMYYDNSVKNR